MSQVRAQWHRIVGFVTERLSHEIGQNRRPPRFELYRPLGLSPNPLYRIIYIRQDDRCILIP